MPTPQEVLTRLVEVNPEALLLEPRDAYDRALVDLTDDPQDHWPREEKVWVAVYSAEKCVEAIVELLDCDYTTALEWYSFNTSGAWVGSGTPTFVD